MDKTHYKRTLYFLFNYVPSLYLCQHSHNLLEIKRESGCQETLGDDKQKNNPPYKHLKSPRERSLSHNILEAAISASPFSLEVCLVSWLLFLSILLNTFLTDTSKFLVSQSGLERTQKEMCVGTNVTEKLRKYKIMVRKDSIVSLHNLMEEKTKFPNFLKQRENGHWTKKWHKIYLLWSIQKKKKQE